MFYEKEIEEYKQILFSPEGNQAKNYLKERKILPSTAKFWEMGFCPKNFEPECYKDVKDTFPFWKKMQGRITFPVYNQFGKIISICGRTIYDEKPKYIHYQFPTRKALFGLYQNKNEIFNDNVAFLVEGQLDVISAWQEGFKNCVCTFGAHFSADQIAYIARYCNNIGVLYDNDAAGRTGAVESYDKLKTRGGLNIKIFCPMKIGEDVDIWVKQNNWQITKDWFNNHSADEDPQ